ncbi:hypothetical protein GOBAR_AA33991 [Gossypium barbadense]|uniref:Uncharacterized protein n=1 Tax=Gossypium barbadense TaxID=3634 RepID=A0A2P5W6J1_GOSBA|nr:hypothetical protein GOBAR_AA33991 [Gossypium barbadense]
MVQPTLQEISLKDEHDSFSSNSRGPVHEDRRLQIEELKEWQTHKPRTPDKLNLRQNELNTFPNQLKIGDRVLLDTADPHIVATTPNEEIPLMVLSIFPFGTIEVKHPKFGTFKAVIEQVQLADAIRALLTTDPWELFFGIIEPTYLELTMELCSTFYLQTAYIWRSSRRKMSYMLSLATYIFLPGKCWHTLAPGAAYYNPSLSKALVLPPSLSPRYSAPDGAA